MFVNSPYNPYMTNSYSTATPYPQAFQNNSVPQQTPQTNLNWVKVQSLQQVKDAQGQPNTTTWYMHNGGEWISCKAVDSMGIPTLKAWKVSEISMDGNYNPDNDIYATKNELSEIKNEIEELKVSLRPQKSTKKEVLDK